MRRLPTAACLAAILLTAVPVNAAKGPCKKGRSTEKKGLFEGIALIEETCADPLYHAYIVEMDLTAPGYRFQVTPYKKRRLVTTKFAEKFDALVATNGGFWSPEWGGFTVADGVLWPKDAMDNDLAPVIGFGAPGKDGLRVEIRPPEEILEEPPEWMQQALMGNPLILDGGEVVEHEVEHTLFQHRHPRTALGLSEDGKTMWLAVVDGRQPGYSKGMRIWEMARLLASHGASRAANLDGGSSSTLAIPSLGGLVNDPCFKKAEERSVPNHLGILRVDSPSKKKKKKKKGTLGWMLAPALRIAHLIVH